MGQVAPGIDGHIPVLHQAHQLPLLLPGDLVGLCGRVNAPACHHDRLHTGRQQLDQRPLGGMVGQQGKIPGDAVIELLLAQGGLQVDLGVVLVLFHIAQMAGRAQGQRAADAKVGEQHLALLLKDVLAVLKKGQGHIFQGKPHHLFAVRVMADQTDQTGHRLHKGVPGLPGQPVAVTGGAGGGVAHTAGGHQHGIGPVFFPGSPPHTDTAQGRPGFFLFGMARIFRHGRGGFRLRRQLFQKQLFCPVIDDLRVLCVAEQCLPDLFGFVGHREHPAAALHLQLHAQALEQLHGPGGRERPQRGEQKARIGADMVQKLLRSAVVGHIAAPLARDKNLLTGLVGMLQHRYLMPLPHSGPRRHQPGRTGPHDQHLCHSGSSRNSLPVEICSSLSYQNRPAIAICIPLEKHRKAADSRVCRLGVTASVLRGQDNCRPASLPGGYGFPRRIHS